MQFQVPQFIEVEDKIFGPLTTKQFFYLLGAGAVIFIMYVFFQLWIVIIFGLPLGGFALAMAFLKLDGVPFIKVVGNALGYAGANRLYLWKKVPKSPSSIPLEARAYGAAGAKGASPLTGPRLTESKLQDLAWSLDIQQQINRRNKGKI